jgi:hypothetical protein
MNYGRLVLSALAATLVYYAYGFLVNGMLIAKAYLPFTTVYRPQDAIMRYMPFGLAGTFIAALVLAIMFAKGYEGGPVLAEGARFGVLVGVFVVCTHVVDNLVTLNIGRRLSLELAVASLVQWTLVCVTIGLVSKPARAPTP